MNDKNMNKENSDKKAVPSDLSGKGDDLLGTIQMIKDKEIHYGYLEIDLVFRFSDTFRYPLIFEIKSSDSTVESVAIAFDISKISKTKKKIDEGIIVPQICRIIARENFVNYFADIIEQDIKFALYVDKKPKKFENLTFHVLTNEQKIIFNEHLVMAIMKVLDERKKQKEDDSGIK